MEHLVEKSSICVDFESVREQAESKVAFPSRTLNLNQVVQISFYLTRSLCLSEQAKDELDYFPSIASEFSANVLSTELSCFNSCLRITVRLLPDLASNG